MTWMGRRLAEFEPLCPAERKLVEEMRTGMAVRISPGLPPEDAPKEHRLRASFVRYLALGGCDACRPPEKGVRVRGALIEGDGPEGAETRGLDLEGGTLPGDLGLLSCRFPDRVLLRGARLVTLHLGRSAIHCGLEADRLEAKGSVFLREGFEATGEVRLHGAKLGGDFDCTGATFRAEKDAQGAPGDALAADQLEAKGSVFLREGFEATGEVRLLGVKLGGDLDCTGAKFRAAKDAEGNPSRALSADGLEARGDVFLRGLEATGEVRVVGATIGGNLDCTGAKFRAETDAQGRHGHALKCDGLRAEGGFLLRGGASIDGMLDLTGAEVGALIDAADAWPAKALLMLQRFQYRAIINAPVDAERRLDWLDRQDPGRWGDDFWPQPYEQLAKVLREMGHGDDAKAVLIEKEWRARAARRGRNAAPWRQVLWLWDGILGLTVRYGREPLLAFVWLAMFFAVGLVVFASAEGAGAIKPNTAFVLRSPEWIECRDGGDEARPGETQLACYLRQPQAQGYPRFNAPIYSLDTLLPIVSLEMQAYWIPDEATDFGWWARGYLWFHIAVGWALSLLAVAGFSGLVKSS